MMTINILIAEDQTATTKILTEFLDTYDKIQFVVSQASTLSNTISQIEMNDNLDVILLDLNLGRSKWYQTLPAVEQALIAKELKKDPTQDMDKLVTIPVIAMTGDVTIEDTDIDKFRVKALLRKPFLLSPLFEQTVLSGTFHCLKRENDEDRSRIAQAEKLFNSFYSPTSKGY